MDRFSETPWDGMEHCYYCSKDYKADKNWPHICESENDPLIVTWKNPKPEEYCSKCREGIYSGNGRFRVFGEVFCSLCGEKYAKTRWEALNDI